MMTKRAPEETGTKTVLVIDDEPGLRESLRKLLEPEFNVHVSESVDEGVALFRRHRAETVIIDYFMPEKNGIEGLREIRGIDSSASVIMLTGYADLETARKALELGAVQYMTKPFNLLDMRRIVGASVKECCLRRKTDGSGNGNGDGNGNGTEHTNGSGSGNGNGNGKRLEETAAVEVEGRIASIPDTCQVRGDLKPGAENAFGQLGDLDFDLENYVAGRTRGGDEFRGTVLRLNRYSLVCEVFSPQISFEVGEHLKELKIVVGDREVYLGVAKVRNLVDAKLSVICELGLENAWLDAGYQAVLGDREKLGKEVSDLYRKWRALQEVDDEFKVVVSDMRTLLLESKAWLEKIELALRSLPGKEKLDIEEEVVREVGEHLLPALSALFQRFETVVAKIPEESAELHRTYVRRHLHPHLMCSPFAHRVFFKPLGFAGDYGMVDQLLNDPYAGGSMFAKILNAYMITSPSGEAYRNRIRVLTEALTAETVRCYRGGGTARVFDMGCGPVREVQSFLAQEDISDHARFTLVDFNDETIRYARESLSSLKSSLRRFTHFEFVQNSVNNVLCEGTRLMKGKDPGHAEGLVSFGQYDMVYCAGLFDYLSDRMCKRLVEIFYRMLAPDGLMVVSNFSTANPNRGFMGYMVDWNLVHRTEQGMMSLAPGEARKDLVQLIASPNKVEYYLKIRRPPDEGQGSAEPR